MAVLDCESYTSTLESISTLYGITCHQVFDFLCSIDLEEEFKNKNMYKSPDNHLKDLFEIEFKQPIQRLQKTHWFHLTRVPENTNFSEGILPLHEVIGRMWSIIEAILVSPKEKKNIITLRARDALDFQYHLKTKYLIHSGPYAMLVREAAFNANALRNHDYLEIPEILEDICNGYRKVFGDSIYPTIVGALKKCIVKFESSKVVGAHLIAPALVYCWCKSKNVDLSSDANTCFDSGGEVIPKEAIISVEFL